MFKLPDSFYYFGVKQTIHFMTNGTSKEVENLLKEFESYGAKKIDCQKKIAVLQDMRLHNCSDTRMLELKNQIEIIKIESRDPFNEKMQHAIDRLADLGYEKYADLWEYFNEVESMYKHKW